MPLQNHPIEFPSVKNYILLLKKKSKNNSSGRFQYGGKPIPR